MKKEVLQIQGREFLWMEGTNAKVLLLQLVGDHEVENIAVENAEIKKRSNVPFSMAALRIRDWNRELSPWHAPAAFGKIPFGGDGTETLTFLEQNGIPAIRERLDGKNLPIVIGGYSLAGLFALWSSYHNRCFCSVAAASPSVWFPGWREFFLSHESYAEYIYLSLGKKEAKTRNATMATVATQIQELYDRLSETKQCQECTLVWNEGNHFQNVPSRQAAAFAWCLNQMFQMPCG